jgi:hypothetical protein
MHYRQELTDENAIESKENGQFVVRALQKATTIDVPFWFFAFWFSDSLRPFKCMFLPGNPAIIRICVKSTIRIWTVANI